ncbi:deacetylase of acetyl-CoA synthetase, NAD-dependent [Alteromonas sp. 38]|uniref:Sir2 family NAD+-dependent deacetylase n=1 Tax=unclassified Alteromonas TaxID=2614992 RepID=UPI0012F3FB45|nr:MULTISPECIES: Sir2 family NAD+-dependent deacetylase [unclassified Alteromonas]CAD5275168.1 deacetylase of acetyl-CoA synthetase, NAD-dependent [Alteromonas sp. 154]VXB63990.1 deacetylase of acetyl-CoA synthetase, NAD-dependent [Alteromonas sp. 38]
MNTPPRVVVLTGAGISAESGLKTFRDNNGLWEEHSVEDVATPEAFARNPELVYRFYNERRLQLTNACVMPNAAHEALAQLERVLKGQLTLITQNVDDLHERAGSEQILHMHGKLLSSRCVTTNKTFECNTAFDGQTTCACCNTTTLRPDILWFGEMPLYMEEISQDIANADIFVAIGTSGNVYPAAGFVINAKDSGAKCVELNLEPSANNWLFDESISGNATDIVPAFVTRLIKEYDL